MNDTLPIHADTERARSALWALDAGADRQEWARIGMSAKAAGLDFDDFNDWSATAGNYGGQADTRTAWNSFKEGDGINAGTLFFLARKAGWIDQSTEQKPEPKGGTKKDPADFWKRGTAAPADHPYIRRKGGKADGLRVVSWPLRGWADFKGQTLEGWLMVPVLGADGGLASIQFIGPNGGEKLNAPGCRMAGTFTMGQLEQGAPAYIVEGIGHAWSIHTLTGKAAVVSFGAGNIEKAAAAIKAAGAAPVIVPDRGKEDQARAAALRQGCACAVLPGDLQEGADINDLHLARGAEAVLAVLKSAAPVTLPERKAAPVPANDNAPIDVHSMQPVAFMSWPHMSDKGQPLNTIPNLEHLLDNYGVTVRYDVISKDLQVRYPGQFGTPDNQRTTAINEVLSLCALNRLPKTDAPAFLLNVGDRNPVNPVMDFITSKTWDGRSRLNDLMATVRTRPDFDRDMFALLLRRWLISAVAAAAMPSGFRSKGVLVFQGPQSLGKTAWIRALLPEELRDLVKIDATIDPDNKDTVISAVSHWLVELGELDGVLRKADIARLKGFISQDVDQFRRPYGRAEEKFQRRTVFFASVNPELFLADDTGNVRWWTIPVTAVNYEHALDVQQVWAEVFEWFKAGERLWLDRDEEARLEDANSDHQQADPIEELIIARIQEDNAATTRPMTATQVLLAIGYRNPTKAQTNTAATTLRRLCGEPSRTGKGRFFDVPFVSRQYEDRPF